MDISILESFITVCQEKKMTVAADKLFLSKQAMSNSIRKLEQEVGCQLLLRTRAGIELTPEGECFYHNAVQMLDIWKKTKNEMSAISEKRREVLVVGFGYLCWNLWNHEAEEQFSRENPGIALQTLTETSLKMVKRLDNREIDLMVTGIDTAVFQNQYACETIDTNPKMVWMAEEDALSALSAVKPEHIANRRVYCFIGDAEYLKRFVAYLAQRQITIDPRYMEPGNILATMRTLREENALLLIGSILKPTLEQVQGFTGRALLGNAPSSAISALTLKEESKSEAKARFIRFFQRVLKSGESRTGK